jgi:hypothetical protein
MTPSILFGVLLPLVFAALGVWFLVAPESARRAGIALHRPFHRRGPTESVGDELQIVQPKPKHRRHKIVARLPGGCRC